MKLFSLSLQPIGILRLAFALVLGGVLFVALPAHAQNDAAADKPAVESPQAGAEKKEAEAQGGLGDLLITSTRVVLDDKKRFSDVTLINHGSKEATYRVILKHMRMLDNGTYEEVDDKHPAKPSENFADDVVRYSPRQVTLKPGESQSVKFTVRALQNVQPGEYRSHVLFQGNPDTSKGSDIEQTTTDNKSISVHLTPIYGISIPLIVRHGELNATATLTSASVSGKKLNVTIERQGTRSVFGDITVTKGETVVGQMRGLSVFVPNDKRAVQVDLTPPDDISISGSELTVTYREREEDGGKVLAETKVRG